jgi:hypothetical protein
VGEVSYGTAIDGDNSFTLVPLYALKGDLKPGVAVVVTYRVRAIPIRGRGEFGGEFGLWFLTRAATGGYTLVAPDQQSPPLEYAYYPLPRTARERPAVPPGTSLVEEIFQHLALSAQSVGRGMTFWHLAKGALSCVDSSAPKSVRETLEAWSRSSSPNMVTLGLTGLVTIGDAGALARSQQALPVIKESEPQLLGHYADAVFAYRNPDPDGVQALGEMATAEEPLTKGLQRAAVIALRAIHSKDTLSHLAKVLDSPEPELRGAAVAGFTLFVNNSPIETPGAVVGMAFTRPVANAPYRTADTDRYNSMGRFERAEDEQAAVQFWKTWWAENKVKLGYTGP